MDHLSRLEREKIAKIKNSQDEAKFLTSLAYRDYLQQLCRATTRKNIAVRFQPNKIATDGKTIWVDPTHRILSGFKSVAEKTLVILGMLAHETFHILYTNFQTLKTLTRLYRAEGQFRMWVVKQLLNIVEDAAIELAGTNYYQGSFRTAIFALNELAYEKHPTIDQLEARGSFRISVFLELCTSYGSTGRIKGEIHDPLLLGAFAKAIPLIDQGRVAPDSWGRFAVAEHLYRIALPFIEEVEQQAQQAAAQAQYNPVKNQEISSGGEGVQPQKMPPITFDPQKNTREQTRQKVQQQNKAQQGESGDSQDEDAGEDGSGEDGSDQVNSTESNSDQKEAKDGKPEGSENGETKETGNGSSETAEQRKDTGEGQSDRTQSSESKQNQTDGTDGTDNGEGEETTGDSATTDEQREGVSGGRSGQDTSEAGKPQAKDGEGRSSDASESEPSHDEDHAGGGTGQDADDADNGTQASGPRTSKDSSDSERGRGEGDADSEADNGPDGTDSGSDNVNTQQESARAKSDDAASGNGSGEGEDSADNESYGTDPAESSSGETDISDGRAARYQNAGEDADPNENIQGRTSKHDESLGNRYPEGLTVSEDAVEAEQKLVREGMREALKGIEDQLQHVRTEAAKEEADREYQREQDEAIHEFARNFKPSELHKHITVQVVREFEMDDRMREIYEQTFAQIKTYTYTLAKNFRRMLRLNEDDKSSGEYEGKVDQNRLSRTDGRIFYKRNEKSDEGDLAVLVLVDLSGSMRGSRIMYARLACMLLCEVCEKLHIPIAVLGHYALNGKTIVRHLHFVDFNSRDRDEKYKLVGLAACENTREGVSLAYAGQYLLRRPEKDKILIAISDGAPYHPTRFDTYAGDVSQRDTARVAKELEKKGIDVIGVAIGEGQSAIKAIYTQKFIDIPDLEELPKRLANIIKQSLIKRR